MLPFANIGIIMKRIHASFARKLQIAARNPTAAHAPANQLVTRRSGAAAGAKRRSTKLAHQIAQPRLAMHIENIHVR